MLEITRKHHDEMIKHALETNPVECCGIIAGSGARVTKVIRVKNDTPTATEYSMNAAELKRALDTLDADRLDFIGIYHSHPTSIAYPSRVDITKAIWPELYYVIISLLESSRPELKSFKIVDGKVVEEE